MMTAGLVMSSVSSDEIDEEQIEKLKEGDILESTFTEFAEQSPEWGERLRQEVLAGQLGRYPNYPEQQRQRQLREASQQLLETQPELRLFVATATVNDKTYFRMIAQ